MREQGTNPHSFVVVLVFSELVLTRSQRQSFLSRGHPRDAFDRRERVWASLSRSPQIASAW